MWKWITTWNLSNVVKILHNLWLDLKLKSGSVQIRPPFFFFFFLIGLLAAGCDGFMMYGFGLWTTTCGKYCLNGFNGLWPDWMGLKGLSVGSAKCSFGSQAFCCIFWLGHRRQNGQFMLMRLLDGAEKNISAFWQHGKMEHGFIGSMMPKYRL